MDSTSMSPADFSAMMGNNNAFGGGNSWWIIILFLFLMNGNGWNRGDYGNATQQEILFGQRFQSLDNKMDRLGNGIADATFALNNTIHNAQDVVAGAVGNEGRAIQMQIANLAAQTDKQTCAITTAIHAEGEQTRALIQQNEIQALRDRVQSLEADNRMCGVVRYPMQYSYASTANPFCNCNCGNNNI